jgi:hypothetical protein
MRFALQPETETAGDLVTLRLARDSQRFAQLICNAEPSLSV